MLARDGVPVVEVHAVEEDVRRRRARAAVLEVRVVAAEAAGELAADDRDVRRSLHPEPVGDDVAERDVVGVVGQIDLAYQHVPPLDVVGPHAN